MEECSVCDVRALCVCTTCKINLCKDHRVLHEKTKKGEHNFENFAKSLSSEEIIKIAKNLSLKIITADKCKARIIQETKELIEKIQNFCTQALSNIKQKQALHEFFLSDS